MEDATRARLEQVLDGYFDLRTSAMVERVLATATEAELADPEELDRLYATFVALLEERYDRADAGWRAGAEALLATEWDRQVEAARAFEEGFEREFERSLGRPGSPEGGS